MSDFVEMDIQEALSRIRLLADARASEVPNGTDEAWREERRQRLRMTEVHPAHVKLALARLDCPALEGHAGSIAAAKAATRFVSDRSLTLCIIAGPTGRGKTVAATWAAGALDACYWISAKDVRVGDAWSQAFPRALKAANLIVDDLGQEGTDWASGELGSLIESRYDKGRRTLATTNLTMAQIAKRYTERLASRACSQYALFASCGGDDLRRA